MFTGTNKTKINSTLKRNAAFINSSPHRGARGAHISIHNVQTLRIHVLILRLIFVQDNEKPLCLSPVQMGLQRQATYSAGTERPLGG